MRVAVVSPELRVADVGFNTAAISEALHKIKASGCQLVLFPELCITAYTCADLFYQSLLLAEAQTALASIAETTQRLDITTVVGLPVSLHGRLFNCAAFVSSGSVLGLVPKIFLPTTNESYEERWFTSGSRVESTTIELNRV